MTEIVPEPMDHEKRITDLEKQAAWLGDRLWYGTGNLHDRVHKLEDQRLTEEMDRTTMKEDLAQIEQALGLNNYGGKNIITDLREMMDSVEKLKGNFISTKDFHTLMRDVDELKKRGQAQIKFWDYVLFAVVGVVVTALANGIVAPIAARLFGVAP